MTTIPVAAYVDGFNLYNGMHDARGRRGLWLDLESLLSSFLGSNQRLVAVHYFTALVMGPGQARQQAYLDALRLHGTVTQTHVGRFQRKSVKCRKCRASFDVHEEKESDVSFGVQMVEDAAQGVYRQALIVSGDSDMMPAIRSVRRIAPDTRIVAVFPPRRSSYDLQKSADATLHIWDRAPERHQLPDPVRNPEGQDIPRPQYWGA
jgi:uncharacterized LabA/DUF88 family protein